MIKKILLGILLLLLPAVSWGQFAEPPDSSTVVGWKFTTFDDVTDTCWLVRQNTSDTLWAHLDDTSAVLWTAITDTAWMLRDAIHDSLYANSPGFLIQVQSDEDIRAGTATDEYYLTYEATGDSFEWVALPGGGDANKSDIHDSLDANWSTFIADDTVDTYREAIHDSLDANWATFISDNNDTVTAYRAAIHDSLDANWSTFTSDDTVEHYREAVHDSLDANWATFTAGNTNADSIKHIPVEDTTGNIGDNHGLIFDQGNSDLEWKEFFLAPVTAPTDNYLFKIDTDPDPDTLYWAEDDTVDTYREAIADTIADHWTAFTGGTTNADSIVHIPIEDTTDHIGDLHGLLFDQSADSLLWEEFWATPETDPTDGYVLKIDTDPDPDTFYWAPSIIRKTAEVQTTDAAQTTLVSHTLLDENTYHVEVYVVAVQSDGTDRASYHLACTVYRTGAGVATLQGSVTTLHTQESNVALDATFTVSGSAVRVSITGIVAETWEFGGTMTYINISN